MNLEKAIIVTLIEKINLIERVDGLIRRKSTGGVKALSKKINLSERSTFNLISLMKKMGAPIIFCRYRNSFCYEKKVSFSIGFTYKSESNILSKK